MFIKNSKLYDVLKYLQRLVLPALAVLYATLADTWGWPYPDKISVTIGAVVVFMGAVLELSSAEYHKQEGDAVDD